MKLTVVFLTAVILQVSAASYAQRVSLDVKNASLEDVFTRLRKQSGYNFLYNTEMLNEAKTVSLSVKNKPLKDVLEECFSNQPLTYIINQNNIVITKRPPVIVVSPLLQVITITGKVTDDKGDPLPGVSVIEKGSGNGIVTDASGNYTIKVTGAASVLSYSFLGFTTQEITVGTQTHVNIQLKSAMSNLNEVVVVGYGTQRKVTLTGAVSTLKGDEITVTKNESAINMLTGKVPGVRIQQLSAEPGAYNNQIDIRGYGASPLVVIDGIPRSVADFQRMDPNEIDNVSVLKDASAAIYGVRSANGVILVTTRKGSANAGKFDINYSVNKGWQQFLNLPNGVNALDYMMLKNEQTKRGFGDNFYQQRAPAFSSADMLPYQNGTLQTSDWIGAVMRQNVPQTQHNLNVNGGTEKANYFFNLGYLKQDGVFKSGDMNYNRWNFRSNVNVKITKRLRAEILVSGFTDLKNQPHADVWTMFKYAWNAKPTDQIFANNNPLYPHVEPDNANPVTMTTSSYNGYKIDRNKNFQGQLNLTYDIPGVPGLVGKALYNYGYNTNDNTNVNQKFNLYQYDPQNKTYLPTLVGSPSNVNRSYRYNTSTLMQLSLNYNKKIGDHNITGLLLFEEADNTGDNFSAYREFSLGIPYIFAGDAKNQAAGMDANQIQESVNKGFVGRFTYDYKGKYLAEFSFRNDGNSKFLKGAQWGFFPAGQIGWRLSEEGFIKNLISPTVLSNFKLRASYGLLGDDGSANKVPIIPGYTYPGTGTIFGSNYIAGLNSIGVINPLLTWFTSKTFDVGADISLWNGLLDGTFDYYVRNRSGLLASRATSVPGTVGANLPQENLEGDQTKGFELILSHRNHIGQVGYSVSINGSIARSMWKAKQETRAGNEYDNWKNAQTDRYKNIWKGRVYDGRYMTYADIYNSKVNTGGGNQNVIPGDFYYKDWNNDGVIDGKEDDQPIATRDLPLVNFGSTIALNYKGFDMNMLLQGAALFHVQYGEQLASPLMYSGSALTQFLDRWHTADPTADVFNPKTVWVEGRYPAMGSPDAAGTKAVQNASYIRIKSLEVGYTVPFKALKRIGVSRLRVYANSYNLATITGLKGADPEHPGVQSDFNVFQGGYVYPLNRTFNLGANITF